MNTQSTERRKTFADEPAWNSGAALGFIAGSLVGLMMAAGRFSIPGLESYELTWAAQVVAMASVGTLVGAISGVLLDLRDPR